MEIWTAGHSNRTLEELLCILEVYRLQMLADVRRYPGSRRSPHFGGQALERSLRGAGIEYLHFSELGGRRVANRSSRSTAWRNAAFRGYADYMETSEFQAGVDRLCEIASKWRTVIMCAEACWWQCHRSLIADFLKVRGYTVWNIFDARRAEEHPYTAAATVVGGHLSYVAPDELPFR